MCNWRNQPKDTQRRVYRRIPHPRPTALRCSGSRNHPRRESRSGAGYLQDGATSIAYQHRFVEAGRRMSMERLTMHTPDNFGYAEYQLKPGVDEQDAVSRLAAYEDTGLEPKENKDFIERWKYAAELAGLCKEMGADRLRELAEADRDGRCMILPCKIGSTVYMATQVFDGSKTKWVI